ncbi:exopolyphosphatase [Dokdonella koreensis]|uniref:Exopolyphosphatase n=1 Tax=Dokdonella koreensis DS-123 TaxID=1300342 RepID=A0A160DWB5_9GAMM|nr:exopolyphosphatase [Dokdonella koreensis]ANB18714.1 Exopolyphosphatase [Dokdonella koreensis DS-123]
MTDANEIRNGELLAAVDIGSNSFHMIVARYEHGELRVIDRLRDSVRLAMGLGPDGSLATTQRQRALACLAQFGQRLRGLPHSRVHAVATNAVRQLANPQAFLLPAETALGHPIEIVSGREEARLIYLGVANGLPRGKQRRLIVDIGGGSTEFIIGQDFEALERESIQVGCVASTRRFFEDGKLTPKRWRQAATEIGVELQQFAADYRSRGWAEAFGSSGTVRAIGSIVQANRWSDAGISFDSLERLRDALIAAGSIQALNLPGLSEERAQVIAGGVVILESVFAALGVVQMGVCETSMREGLLYDMLGRAMHRDPRSGAIAALVERYAVDRSQAARVRETALILFDQAAADWQLEPIDRDVLGWCADIHEIGLAIAHSQHHVHGAYIVAHSDLAGFSQQGQQLLETILRSQRRRPHRGGFEALPERLQTIARRLTALLRLAVLLHRGRTNEPLPRLLLQAGERSLRLTLPSLWLEQHPLTRADLEQESDYFKPLGLKLQIGTR